jgi:hypothetical protein
MNKVEFQAQLRESHMDALRRLHEARYAHPREITKLKLLCYQLRLWRQEIDIEPDW